MTTQESWAPASPQGDALSDRTSPRAVLGRLVPVVETWMLSRTIANGGLSP